ncbi:uncharacterized protein V1518DRAFT_408144 [Limtongia smithiae]|uniref:uncharacterized protein n=1 Tax=Limtongia smithiae TaxID=1125753 RepID=UPI0034CF2B71
MRPRMLVCRACAAARLALPTTARRRLLHTTPAACKTVSAEPFPSAASVLARMPVSQGSVAEDDRMLRAVFDSADVWRDFTSGHQRRQHRGAATGRASTGLLMNSRLHSAESLVEFASTTLHTARLVVTKIVTLPDTELRAAVRLFDRLSDILCRVIDLAEFVRTVHPDPHFLRAAEHAHQLMMGYMIELNSSEELFTVLQRAVSGQGANMTREEAIVARMFLYDFEKSGAGLSQDVRDKVMSTQNEIALLSREFTKGLHPRERSIKVHINDLEGMDPMIVSVLRYAAATQTEPDALAAENFMFDRRNISKSMQAKLDKVREVRLPTSGSVKRMASFSLKSAKIRQQLYTESRSADARQIEILEYLLLQRMNLARLLGANSYADYQLADKMARNPTSVNMFLENLRTKTAPGAQQEISILASMKRSANADKDTQFRAWDRDYYLSQYLYRTRTRTRIRSPDVLNAYFSVGVVMQGLSRLFTRLYGIRFVPCETSVGETWHEDVRKLDIMADAGPKSLEGEQRVGIMYCDLFERAGKPHGQAHYTVRCSRRVFPDEFTDGLDPGVQDFPTLTTDTGVFQVPTIGLVCDFPSQNDGRPRLLSFPEVETLFHEMGHAMHSMLGRTELHNISGTRCATDFVELPSVLMEYFASCPDVLALYARHYETDEPLPLELLDMHFSDQTKFRHNDVYTQIEMALLDQALHTVTPDSLRRGYIDSCAIYSALEQRVSLYPPVPGANWQGLFGHLIGYGGVYYAYLLDRAIASQVWQRVFHAGKDGGALSRDAGERFKNEVLVWGGGRDAWECLAGLLEREELAPGGAKAMELLAIGAGDDISAAR